jgi:hypothetical protein
MFTVRWVARGQEVSSIEIEKYSVRNPDVIVEGCRLRLRGIQQGHPHAKIDGFIVVDDAEQIVRAWFPFGK